MEGRGVTNFSVDKPSHGFTTKTTQFDDELIRRGIVTTEQAMMAKGASAEEAIRLANEKRGKNTSAIPQQQQPEVQSKPDSDESDDDSFEDDFDDDAFLQEYRQQRLEELKQEQAAKQLSHSSQSSVSHIARYQWKQAVNEASTDGWVLVTMVEASGDRKDRVVQELQRFSNEFGNEDELPSLLTIDAGDAIPNWPQERVPAMFAYKDGVKQHEWIAGRRGEFPPSKLLEQILRTWKVI